MNRILLHFSASYPGWKLHVTNLTSGCYIIFTISIELDKEKNIIISYKKNCDLGCCNYCYEGVWEHPPGSVSCAPGVALLYGGAGLTTTEAYSSTSTCSIKLPDYEHTLTGHSMEYIGVPVMCGGRIGAEITASNKCWVLKDNQAEG